MPSIKLGGLLASCHHPAGTALRTTMASPRNTPIDNDAPPPAYHDGRAIQRLPAYREGRLLRHHPYARYVPSLFRRLQLSPYAYELDYALVPVNFAVNAGIRVGFGDSTAEGAAVSAAEDSNAPIPLPASSAQAGPSEGAPASHGVLNFPAQTTKPSMSTSRPAKRKRDDFEGEGDSE
ncbi:hypothetical protein PENSPDRAFT_759274 [Peniophora sp. CONT]|nr:hypothetical protein PENSPDRAFT_759274 [Peniophora sp. CONT]